MGHSVVFIGKGDAFTGDFRKRVEDCGYEVRTGPCDRQADPGDLRIFEVADMEDLRRLKERGAHEQAEPFLVFASIDALDELQSLKEAGLMGVVSPSSSAEDASFLLNKALFYNKMLKRNPRVPVNIPVELKSGPRIMRTNASHLSRDGMFIVTLSPLPVNALCQLKFSLPGSKGQLETAARVLYNIAINKDLNIIANPKDPFKRLVSHPGMAIFFTGLSDAEKEEIDGYIKALE